MTFLWASAAQKIHADLRLCRAKVYRKCVAGWMDLRRRFWAAVHHPIDPDEDEGDPDNPGLQAICFLIKSFQIHVEFVALRRFNYWIGNAGLPAVALKREYLSPYLAGGDNYDSSASQWASNMIQRIPLELFLSACLLAVGSFLDIYVHTHEYFLNLESKKRWLNWNNKFHRDLWVISCVLITISAAIQIRAAYHVLYPMYQLLRPLCTLHLSRFLSGDSFMEGSSSIVHHWWPESVWRFAQVWSDTIWSFENRWSILTLLFVLAVVVPFVNLFINALWTFMYKSIEWIMVTARPNLHHNYTGYKTFGDYPVDFGRMLLGNWITICRSFLLRDATPSKDNHH
ncbi:hypothetical protein PG997_010162 [Apiospora hydei]|uniref:Uncharacterized protein n=1 Tax=Apiospora hydei TaxID=1337664 RepID=A0ABR1VZZ1_9PEZI